MGLSPIDGISTLSVDSLPYIPKCDSPDCTSATDHQTALGSCGICFGKDLVMFGRYDTTARSVRLIRYMSQEGRGCRAKKSREAIRVHQPSTQTEIQHERALPQICIFACTLMVLPVHSLALVATIVGWSRVAVNVHALAAPLAVNACCLAADCATSWW